MQGYHIIRLQGSSLCIGSVPSFLTSLMITSYEKEFTIFVKWKLGGLTRSQGFWFSKDDPVWHSKRKKKKR